MSVSSYSVYSTLDNYIGCNSVSAADAAAQSAVQSSIEITNAAETKAINLEQKFHGITPAPSVTTAPMVTPSPSVTSAPMMTPSTPMLTQVPTKEGFYEMPSQFYDTMNTYNNLGCHSYTVQNYKKINTDSLTHGGLIPKYGHFNIVNAYGQDALTCKSDTIENYIQSTNNVILPIISSFTFIISPGNGNIVQFTDTSINRNSINTPTTWNWNFGDGNTSSLKNPSHTYSSTGNFIVTLICSNSKGSNSSQQTIVIQNSIAPLFHH